MVVTKPRQTLKRLLVGELTWRRLVRSFLEIQILLYIGVLTYAYFYSERVIFQPPPPSYTDSGSITKVGVGEADTISLMVLPNPTAEFTILFSHGNAEDLGHLTQHLDDLRGLGFQVAAFDYRGYGTSSGSPSEEGVYRDILAAFDYVRFDLGVDERRIILYGRSLGAAVAADLASRELVGGLILESAFLSAFTVATGVTIFPIDRFETVSKLKSIHCPILIMHGRQDEVIPFEHGERLFDRANAPKQALWIEDAGHNNFAEAAGPEFRVALDAFKTLVARGLE